MVVADDPAVEAAATVRAAVNRKEACHLPIIGFKRDVDWVSEAI